MGLVFCPECNKKVSQYAETCPDCGFPISKFMDDNNITDVTKAFVCPKCADIYFGYKEGHNPLNIKCKYCSSIVVQTEENSDELFKLRIYVPTKEQYEIRSIHLAKQYGNNQFSQEEYEKRLNITEKIITENNRQRELKKQQSQQQNIPKCPTCQSTNIRRISGTKKAASIIGFGILSSNLGKTYECLNCKHKW